jgi:thiol-disulfide isomerase/thioredoxin
LDLTDSDGERKEFTFTLAPRAGEAAPNVTLTRLDTGETVTLDAFRGQVVLLEFWASWCGPCQQPMSEYDRLMREHAEEWEGKAVIIGASIDERIETIRNHVEKRGWTNVVQVHCGQGTWESEAATSFGVRSVPSACLIDPTGQIIWIGHPSSIDVEERIRAYLEANAAGSG